MRLVVTPVIWSFLGHRPTIGVMRTLANAGPRLLALRVLQHRHRIWLFRTKHHWLQQTKAEHWEAYMTEFFREFGIWPEEHAKWCEAALRNTRKQVKGISSAPKAFGASQGF